MTTWGANVSFRRIKEQEQGSVCMVGIGAVEACG